MTPAPVQPALRSIVVVKVDTLGDLIVFAPTLKALRSALPDTRITAIIRRGYADLAPLLADGIDWLTTTLEPFGRGPDEDKPELDRVRQAVAAAAPDVVLAATSRRNWVEIAVAATSGSPHRIALGADQHDTFFATQIRLKLGIEASAAFTQHLEVDASEPDWQRGLALADALLGHGVPSVLPSVRRPVGEPGERTRRFLTEKGIEPGRFLVCAAAGFANVALKTWPADRFGAVLRHARERHGLPCVLVGHENERSHLETVAAAAGGGVSLWLGGEGTLPQLASLIADATLFLGNDTGAMHLAAALDVPVVAVFGGGTWPRFVPAARRHVSVVQPLPCFGCGWDCAFGDAPCIGGITVADVTAALDDAIARGNASFGEIRPVQHLSESTRVMMGKAAATYREAGAGHLARQHKLEELTALDREKDREIAALKTVCDEREKTIFVLDGHVRNLQAHAAALEADKAVLEKTLRDLPPDRAQAARAIGDQLVHIRNIEALLKIREHELSELRIATANRAAGLHDLEQAKHYGRLLAEKERVIGELRRSCAHQEKLIRQLTAEATTVGARAAKLWAATRGFAREKLGRPFDTWLFTRAVERYWMQIGVLRHYEPRRLKWDERLPSPRLADAALPQIGIVTPSYGQEKFIERTLRSVLDQHYPKLRYVVQDGGSKDRSAEIIARHAERLHHWESVKDKGQADAIGRGFAHVTSALGPDDIMAWINSDDLFGPGVLRYVAEFFTRHPAVDVIYGHRIIIDDNDQDVGRWIMPRHDPATLEWIDYVPQETLFWRKRAWDLAGGIDPSFQFALDWDLLARFQQAGCRIVRVPYFLGAFRVHAEQKTSQAIHTTGAEEMRRIRTRFHGERQEDGETIERHARHTRFWGAVTARLLEIGIRW